MQVASQKFHNICESYEVLSDPKKRTIYDQFGGEVLSLGFSEGSADTIGGYKYKENAFEIFETFFTKFLPFDKIFDDTGSELFGSFFGDSMGGMRNQKGEKPDDIHVKLECSLEEFYNGCMKTFDYERKELTLDNQNVLPKRYTKTIEVKPGFTTENKLTFKEQGHQDFNHPQADLIVTFTEKQTGSYIRRGNDLIYTHDISLVDAINVVPVDLQTLDGRILNISMDQIITPQTVKIVEGEGMPIYDEAKERNVNEVCCAKGKLYIKFNIFFPKTLDESKKERLDKVLTIDE